MDRATISNDGEEERIVLNLLNSVDDGAQSQRRIAEDLGIALGLVNAYLKRCVKKGYVKVSQAPARRYAYYLTPKGFAEKSRLTVQYLSDSFSFFRQAKEDCAGKRAQFPGHRALGQVGLGRNSGLVGGRLRGFDRGHRRSRGRWIDIRRQAGCQ